MKKTLFILTILALGLTACNKETDQPVSVYHISIPASMGAETKAVDFSGTDPVTGKPTAVSSFKTTDKIYVYNRTKEEMLTGNLTPSADGKTCDLEGTLTGTISVDDEILLLYNMNLLDADPTECAYYYLDLY